MKTEETNITRWAFIAAMLSIALMMFIRLKLGENFLLADRIFKTGGIFQIIFTGIIAFYICFKLIKGRNTARFRKTIWLIFSIWFFLQLLLGIFIDNIFLLNDKLHFPIPSVILSGAIYRNEIGFMPILFFVSVILSSGAWCSFLCYFGSFDALAAGKNHKLLNYQKRNMFIKLRYAFLFLFVMTAFLLRIFNVSTFYAVLAGIISAILGIIIIVFYSSKNKNMTHCTAFCPIGTIVCHLKFLSAFRFKINTEKCDKCMACIKSCSYSALSPKGIKNGKISKSCSMCTDCIETCDKGALEVKLFNINPSKSKNIFFVIIAVLFSLFFSVARV